MKKRKHFIILFLAPCIALFTLIYVLPIGLVVGSSFFQWKAGAVIEFVGLRNYIEAFTQDAKLMASLGHTLIWVLLQSTVHVALGTVVAFILSRRRFGWKFFRTVYMIPNVISMAALALIFLNIFNPEYGVFNSLIRLFAGPDFFQNWYFDTNTAFLTVTAGWLFFAGLITILVLTGIFSVPEEIREAARIDGASQWQIDIKITLPLIRNVLGTCVILAATSMLREFELIYLTTRGGPGHYTLNLPLYLYNTALKENNYAYSNMMGTLLIILGIAAVFTINKAFRMNESEM